MKRKGAEIELLLISEAVACLKVGMYGGCAEPKPVAGIKKGIKKSIEKGERGPSIEWEPQEEEAASKIYKAITEGKLSVFVVAASTDDEMHRIRLQVPIGVLEQMITTHGGLPDRTVEARRTFAKDQIAPELLAALSTSALYLRRREFKAWYEEARNKRNWPSQRARSDKNPIGRPSKRRDLRTSIAKLVNAGQWTAEQNFIADLVRLLSSQGATVSRQTVERTVEQLHRETGDPRYHHANPRRLPDESVWGSFKDLAERRRRQHRK